jgi:hypothetical protein
VSFAALIDLIKAGLQFPEAMIQLVKLLRSTPVENHEALLKKISEEAVRFEETGRPTWE